MRRFLPALSLAALLVLALASCGSDKATGLPAGPTEGPETEECDGTVDMTNQLTFVPNTCTVEAGTTVVWKNVSSLQHTVTAVDEKRFDSDILDPGEEFRFTFSSPGLFPYFCRPHSPDKKSGMVGQITIEGGPTPTPTPTS